MANLVIGLFLEDIAHEKFITGIVLKVASESDVRVKFDVRNATGGIPRMRGELSRFLREIDRGGASPFDILIIAQDTDCRGESIIQQELNGVVQRAGYIGTTIVATPAPHIECWYLSDPIAIQTISHSPVLSAVPSGECDKDLYKSELTQAFRNSPLGGGIERADDIVESMDIYRACQNVSSLGHFVDEIRATLNQLTNITR